MSDKEAEPSGKPEPSPASEQKISSRSPGVALGLAIVPGIALHGVGHLYAGSYFKGASLLLLEGASIYLASSNAHSIADDSDRLFNSKDSSGNYQIPTDLGPLTAHIGVASVAVAAFLYTWFDDMGGARTAAEKYNQRQKLAASRGQVLLLPAKDGQGAMMAYTTRF